MLRKTLILIIVVLGVGMLIAKAITFSRLTDEQNGIIRFGRQVDAYYEKYLELPHSEVDFNSFLRTMGDEEYYELIHKLGVKLIYDSLDLTVTLYSKGVDWDDDRCARIYDPYQLNFWNSIFLDGDVVLSRTHLGDVVENLNGFIFLSGQTRSNDPVYEISFKKELKNILQETYDSIFRLDSIEATWLVVKRPSQFWVTARKTIDGQVQLSLIGDTGTRITEQVKLKIKHYLSSEKLYATLPEYKLGTSIFVLSDIGQVELVKKR